MNPARIPKEPEVSVPPRFEAAGRKHYSPRVTFQVRSLTPNQRANLRTAMFVVRLLEARVRMAGSIRKAARLMGVSKTFLGDVLKGKRPPGFHLARLVGYIPKVFYMRVLEDVEEPGKVEADPDIKPDARGVMDDLKDNRVWEKVEYQSSRAVTRRHASQVKIEALDEVGE